MPKADTIHLGENKKTADLRRIFFCTTQHLSRLTAKPVFTSLGAQTSIMPASLTHLVTP